MIIYFFCNSTAPSFNGTVTACANKHADGCPNNRLSVSQDPGMTRAVIQVFNTGKGLVNLPAVLTAYDETELDQLKVAMAAVAPLVEWDNPE